MSERLRRYTSDEDLISRLRVDISDLLEISSWFMSRMESINPEKISDGQLEDVIAELDTKLIWHAQFHLASLSKDIQALMLEKSEP